MKKIKCPLCEALMDYNKINITHKWSCPDCPAILFEYIGKQNILDLEWDLEEWYFKERSRRRDVDDKEL